MTHAGVEHGFTPGLLDGRMAVITSGAGAIGAATAGIAPGRRRGQRLGSRNECRRQPRSRAGAAGARPRSAAPGRSGAAVPVLDPRMDTSSYAAYGTNYPLEARQMSWYWNQYVGADPAGVLAYAGSASAADVRGLAPALIVSAEFDPRRDEAENYPARLAAAGMPTRMIRVDGQTHSFVRVMTAVDAAAADIGNQSPLGGCASRNDRVSHVTQQGSDRGKKPALSPTKYLLECLQSQAEIRMRRDLRD
jgi:hypothetical protein